jgi:hypothetical protein
VSLVPRVLAYTLIPVAAAAVAGLVAATVRPGEKVTSGVRHFAAGVVFAAAAVELLPQVLHQKPGVAVVGFAAGIAVMFGMRALTERLEASGARPTARLLRGGTAHYDSGARRPVDPVSQKGQAAETAGTLLHHERRHDGRCAAAS